MKKLALILSIAIVAVTSILTVPSVSFTIAMIGG